jgi:acyl-CoA thioesterase FadM
MATLDGWLELAKGTVLAEHIDYNGHMNVVHYRAAENLDRDVLAATHEELALHVDLTARRSTPLPPSALAAIEALEATQAQLPPPPDLGRVIAP